MQPSRFAAIAFLTALALFAGCTVTPQEYFEALKGDGFAGWSESTPGMRTASKDAKPSGFFTDKKSEQIERSLGGGF